MILMLLRTGMRIGELLGLTIDDVNIKERRVEIIEARKTRTGRIVYLSEDACRAVKRWYKIRDDKKEKLFYGQGRTTISYEACRSMLKSIWQKQAWRTKTIVFTACATRSPASCSTPACALSVYRCFWGTAILNRPGAMPA